jgi:hypothetical protein
VTSSEIEALTRNTIPPFTHEERAHMHAPLLTDSIASHFGAAPAGTTVVKIVPEYFFAYNHNLHFVDEHTKEVSLATPSSSSGPLSRGSTLQERE